MINRYFKNFVIYFLILTGANCLLLSCSKSKPDVALSFINASTNQGPYNSTVIISGTGFSTNKAENDVRFNGKAAQITGVSSTNLTVKVPLGAGTGNITINRNGVTVTGPVFTYLFTARVSTYAGNGITGASNGAGNTASFNKPNSLAIDVAGNLYVSDSGNALIRKISTDSVVSTLAGGGNTSLETNGSGALASFISAITALALDASGNVYVTEFSGVIRKITPAGGVSTFLDGRFVPGYSFDYPSGLAIDLSGNLYVSVYFQNQIHKITPATVVTNYAGNGNAASEDGSPGSFWNPTGLKFDNAGLLYVADFNNCKIRTIDASKKVSTVAGFSGDFHSISPGSVNGAIGSASFRTPNDVAIDVKGNIYVADTGNHLIRMINADRTTVSSLAGNGTAGSINGLGNAASFNYPNSLVVDASGNIYVADTGNNLIRKIVIY